MEIDSGPDIEQPEAPRYDYVVSATGLVSRTLSVWARNIFAFLVIIGVLAALFNVVQLVVLWILFQDLILAVDLMTYVGTDPFSFFFGLYSLLILPSPPPPDILNTFITGSLLLMLVGMVVYAILAGASIKYSLDDYGPRQAEMGSSISFAMGRAGTLIITQLLIGIISAALFMPALVYLLLVPLTLEALATASIMILVTFILVVYVGVRFAPVAAVVIAEDRSAIGSLKRAFDLTGGQFWHVFAGQIVLGIVTIVLGLIVSVFLFGLVFGFGVIGLLIPGMIAGLLFTAIPYVFQAVLYRDLESRDVETSQQLW